MEVYLETLPTCWGGGPIMLWDVFISHAGEDKQDVARPLSEALTAAGLRVWLDEDELRLGDSLRGKIDQGLRIPSSALWC